MQLAYSTYRDDRLCVYKLYCEGQTESESGRYRLCFPYIIKCNFVVKTWT